MPVMPFILYTELLAMLQCKQGTLKVMVAVILTVKETLWVLSLGRVWLAVVVRMRVRGTVIIIDTTFYHY